jgi:hypothetical protein
MSHKLYRRIMTNEDFNKLLTLIILKTTTIQDSYSLNKMLSRHFEIINLAEIKKLLLENNSIVLEEISPGISKYSITLSGENFLMNNLTCLNDELDNRYGHNQNPIVKIVISKAKSLQV